MPKIQNNLDLFFHPKSVAIIGASAQPEKVGHDILLNVINSFKGKIYPVNINDEVIENIPCYKSVLDIKGTVDLAVIVIPAKFVAKALKECGLKGCKNVVIISAGFKEIGEAGLKLEQELKEIIGKYQINLLGPNCLGFISTLLPLNASFALPFDISGNVAFLSQSGALGTAVLDKAKAQQFGIGYFLSLGNKAGVDEIKLLEYLSGNNEVKVILMYLEDISDGQAFIKVASKVAKIKPIIVLKGGKTSAGQKAVSSHTGSMAGSAAAYSTAFSQCGVIEAGSIEDFYSLAKGFSLQPLPAGNKVAVITNAGGPGILVTDLISESNLVLSSLSEKTVKTLRTFLPEAASTGNPVDILGDAKADRFGRALEAVFGDSNVNSVILVLTPQKMTEVDLTAQLAGKIAKKYKKPIILCFLGEDQITRSYPTFRANSLPYFDSPDQAVNVLAKMYQYAGSKKMPLAAISGKVKSINKNVASQIKSVKVFTEIDCRNILASLKFPLYKAVLVKTEKEAILAAKKIGYPVVLKVVSPDILHKSDQGGVKVNLKNDDELKAGLLAMKKTLAIRAKGAKINGYIVGEMVKGFELIVGVNRDPQFGPLVMIGTGGIYTEIFKDISFLVAPFSKLQAKAAIEKLKCYKLFLGARGQAPLDEEAVIKLLLLISDLVISYPEIKEIDFNPVMVREKGLGCTIADARFLK